MEAANHFFDSFRFLELGLNNTTVLYPINGHSKKRTPLVSSWFYFPRRNSGQTLIKIFLKSGQVISGHYFLHELVYLAFFSLQLMNTLNNFELILEAREKEYKR